MIVELSENEREALLELVVREISDLGPEIRHTRTRSYRDDLKVHKQALRQLLEHLQAHQPA
ncbi:MAG: hypothetical protein V2A79_08515 [Planctomycetota bacterium]